MNQKTNTYLCQNCLNDFNKTKLFWCLKNDTISHEYLLCNDCLKIINPKIYRPVKEKIKRKKRSKDKRYFKCKNCGNITYRDKKKEYTTRQLGCTKCNGFMTLEKIRKPIKKKSGKQRKNKKNKNMATK